MRRSSRVTLSLLGAAMLGTAACGGCFGGRTSTFYDDKGQVVSRSQWKDASGQFRQLYDKNGNPVPTEDVQSAYAATTSERRTSSGGYRHSGGWLAPLFLSSGWRSGSSYSRGGSSWFGSSKPSGSISRGGFGGTHSSGSS